MRKIKSDYNKVILRLVKPPTQGLGSMKKTIEKRFTTRLAEKNLFAKRNFRLSQTKITFGIAALLLICLIFGAEIKAQTEEDDSPIKVDTLLFTIPLTVSDKNGRKVSGLKKENFTVYQDSDKQDIELFLNEETPMNVAILLDTSYSTREVLDKIQKAARDFVKILRPEDKALIVSFDSQTIFLSELTSDRKLLTKAIDRAQISQVNGSNLYDAVNRVVQNFFAPLKGRKAIIALTDAVVSWRAVSAQQILDELQESDTVFYPIIFRTKSFYSTKAGARNATPIRMLEILSEETTGKIYEKEATKLKEAFQSIAEELKKQYLIGFYPTNTRPGGRAPGHIRVEVDRRDMTVRAKKRLKF